MGIGLLALAAAFGQAAASPAPPLHTEPFQTTTVATRVEIDLEFDNAGKPTACRVRDSSLSPASDAKLCADILSGKVPISPPPTPRASIAANDGAPASAARLINLGEVFGKEDYPTEAIKKEEQGMAVASVTVDQAGRPTACRISESSKSASLDATTCALLMQRGRFKISPDAAAGAISHVAPVRVHWSLPEDKGIPFADYRMRTIFAIDHNSKLGSCRLEGMYLPSETNDQCAFKRPVAVNVAQISLTRLPAANRELVMEQGLVIGAADSVRSIGSGPSTLLIWRTGWSILIDADGKVIACEPLEFEEGDDNPDATQRMCAKNKALRFESLPVAQADRSPRHAAIYYVTFLRPRTEATPSRR